jgi:hypothetical protein
MTNDEFENEMDALDVRAANAGKDTEVIVRAVLLLARVLHDFHGDYVRLMP